MRYDENAQKNQKVLLSVIFGQVSLPMKDLKGAWPKTHLLLVL